MKPGSSEYGSGSKSGSVMGKVFESLAAPKFGPGFGGPRIIIRNGLGRHNFVPGFEPIMPRSGYPPQPKNGSKKGYGFAGLLTPPPLRCFYESNLVRPLHEDVGVLFGNVVGMESYCSSEVTSSSSSCSGEKHEDV